MLFADIAVVCFLLQDSDRFVLVPLFLLDSLGRGPRVTAVERVAIDLVLVFAAKDRVGIVGVLHSTRRAPSGLEVPAIVVHGELVLLLRTGCDVLVLHLLLDDTYLFSPPSRLRNAWAVVHEWR